MLWFRLICTRCHIAGSSGPDIIKSIHLKVDGSSNLMSDTSTVTRPDQVLRRVHDHGIKTVDLQFTDVMGMVKTVTIDADILPAALSEGVWFDGSAVEGFARVAESDMYLMPDPSTFAVVPWLSGDEATARLICNVYTPN